MADAQNGIKNVLAILNDGVALVPFVAARIGDWRFHRLERLTRRMLRCAVFRPGRAAVLG